MTQETFLGSDHKQGRAVVVSVDEEESVHLKELCREKVARDVLNAADCVVVGGVQATYSAQHLIHLFRKYGLHDNDRQTVLSQENAFNVMQLCLAEQNKKKFGSFEVEASAVISAMQTLHESKLSKREKDEDSESNSVIEDYEKNLRSSNTVDLWDILNRVTKASSSNEALAEEIKKTNYLIFKLPTSKIEREILSYLLKDHSITLALVEVPLSDEGEGSSAEINISYEELDSIQEAYNRAPTSPCPIKSKTSVTEAYAEKVIMGYLELLVNTRSEIALARIIDVPSRELDHKAFTKLKHAARLKNMSLYQTAVSHIMRIRLGGKSYAPGTENHLSQHSKGLSELVDLVQKLQTIVEEEKDTGRSLKRVMNVIKNAVITHRENTLRKQSVEAVTEKLQEQALAMESFVQSKAMQSPPKSVGQGGSMLGRATLKVIRYLLDSFASRPLEGNILDCLSDSYSSQRTPVRFPSIFAQFRSPTEASPECKSRKTLASRVSLKLKPRPKNGQAVPRFQSGMDWAMPVHDSGFRHEEQFSISDFVPSKTLAHPAENTIVPKVIRKPTPAESRLDQENLDALFSLNQDTSSSLSDKPTHEQSNVKQKSKAQKRTASSVTNSESQAKKSKKVAAPKTSKKKGPTLTKGQTQLTSFFRI